MKSFDWALVFGAWACMVFLMNSMKYTLDNGYPYPLFVTGAHMMATALLSWLWEGDLPSTSKGQVSSVSFADQVEYVWPIAAAQAISTGLSNMGLLRLFPSFVAMLGTTEPAFALLCGLIFGTEKFNSSCYLAMVPVALGFFLLCRNEVGFHWGGLLYVLGSAFFRALKHVLQVRALQQGVNVESLSLLRLISQIGCVVFFIWSTTQEGSIAPIASLFNKSLSWTTLLILLLGTLVSAVFHVVSFFGVNRLNATLWSLVMQLATPLVALASWVIFGNPVTMAQIQALGLLACGATIYNNFGTTAKNMQSANLLYEDSYGATYDI